MKRAVISASRSLRSSLDTKSAPRSSWSPLFGAISTLGSTSTKNEDLDRLSTRLSQRLVSDTTGPINTQQNGNRTLSTRAKNQAKKQWPKAAGAKRTKRKAVTSKTTGRQIEPQWTAVGAALSTLEESIAKTNMLLHSLSSGEALARRTQSSRLTWDQKAALEVSKKKKPTPAHAAKALTALLQELGEKQVLAANLLSRLDEPVNSTKTPSSSTNVKSRGADSITQTISRSENEGPLTREEFESGWGVNELVPSTAENPAFVEAVEQSPMSQKSDGNISAAPIETTSGEFNTSMISLDSKSFLTITRDPEHHVPVPTLKHNLDRVLFNPGVHWLQDPHSRVYNFPPELQIMPAFTSFAYDRVNTFITSSKDTELSDLAKRHGKKFVGSTSSVSMILAHIYFLISAWRPLDLDVLSGAFFHMPRDFSAGQKMPYTFYLRRSDGVLAFDSGSQSEDPLDQNVLSYIGVMLEKLLTLPKAEFDALLQHAPEELIQGMKPAQREAYRYSMSKSLVLRSQLDCADDRLPGTGVFDLKTRAAISVRQDIWNLEVGSGYQIRSSTGPLESFEREYYDLCRSAFLKYSFQARIGAMDGVFVAYHNTSRLFGFQYVPVEEMDQRLFGSHQGGERVFKACLGLLEVVAENVVSCFPDQEVKAMICTSESKDPELSVWVEPANWEELTPAPVHEVRLKVFHQINGERAPSGTQVTFEMEDWRINYTVARLPPSPETRARRDKAYARQQAIRVSSLPEGTTIEEFSNRMKDGVLEGYASRPDAGLSGEQREVSGLELSESAASPDLSAWNKRFRTSTTPLVHSLRALSRKGLEDMDRWAGDTSPKVVYKPRT